MSTLKTRCSLAGLLLSAALTGRSLPHSLLPWQSPQLQLPTHYNARLGLDNGVPRKRKKGRS